MNEQYFCLRDRFALRSWADLPHGLADLKTGNVLVYPEETYAVLLKCTGTVSAGTEAFTEQEFPVLFRLLSAGIVTSAKKPLPAPPAYTVPRKYPVRYINRVHWSVTGKCNYRCRHCYMSAAGCTDEDISLDKIKEIICRMEEAGIMNVSLSGGEALVRPDFREIVDELTSRGIALRAVYSNGFLVNGELMDFLRSRQLRPRFVLSFDGTGGAHEWMRGIPGAAEHFRRAARLLKENGFTFEAEYCLHRGNADRLRDSIRYLAQEGCEQVKVNLLTDLGEGEHIAEYCFSPAEAYECFLDYLPRYYEDGAPLPVLLRGLFRSVGKDRYLIPGCRFTGEINPVDVRVCSHASRVMVLSADGRVMPCVALECAGDFSRSFESVLEKPVGEILEGSFYTRVMDTRLSEYFDAHPECAACPDRFRCAGGCRARAAIAARSACFLEKDEESCVLYRGGYYGRLKTLMKSLGIKELENVPEI